MDLVYLLKVALLAAFQGVAEFLPISSSGHLQVMEYLLGTDPEGNLFLGVLLHGGTLLAVLVFYFRSLWKIVAKWEWKLIMAVIMGTIPAGIVGVLIKKSGVGEAIFSSLLVPAIGFAVTAVMLAFAMKPREGAEAEDAVPIEEITLKQALLIGLAQAVAIVPGISRSGSTIAAGLKAGLKKEDCAQFSFLLAIPAIAGAMLLEMLDFLKNGAAANTGDLIAWGVGFALSAVVGYAALALLVSMLRRGKLRYFAWYLSAAALFTFGLYVYNIFR